MVSLTLAACIVNGNIIILSSYTSFLDAFSDIRFFNEDVEMDELVVGSKMTLYLAAVSKTDASLIVVNKNGKNYKKLFDINLFERLASYANTITDPYVPIVEELCIAEDGTN